MNLIEEIKTIKNPAESKFKEKGSVFNGKAFCILKEEEAENILEEIRKRYFDATHHCYAYKLSTGSIKYSDDGEPSGTAGLRILNAIEHFGLSDCLVAVIRYFGGTKLGVGPLGKAYYQSAYQTLQSAGYIEQKLYFKVTLSFDFQLLSHCHRILSNHKAKIAESDYSARVNMNCLIYAKEIDKVRVELAEISRGQVEIHIKDEYCYQ